MEARFRLPDLVFHFKDSDLNHFSFRRISLDDRPCRTVNTLRKMKLNEDIALGSQYVSYAIQLYNR